MSPARLYIRKSKHNFWFMKILTQGALAKIDIDEFARKLNSSWI